MLVDKIFICGGTLCIWKGVFCQYKVKQGTAVSVCLCERGVIVPVILNRSIRWRWAVRFSPRPLYNREISWTGTIADLGAGEEKDPSPLLASEPRFLGSPDRSLVTM